MSYKINPITGKFDMVSDSGADLSYSNPAYPELDTIKKALDYLLYYNPAVSSFTNNHNTVEIGTVINSVNLAWTLNKDKSLLTALSINNGIGDVLPDTTGTTGSKTHTDTFTTDRTYTMTMNDGQNTATKNTYIRFRHARYWGRIDHKTGISDADILALDGAGIGSGKDLTEQIDKSFNGMDMQSQYFCYAFMSSLGEAQFKVNGLLNGDFSLVRDNAFTNALGITYNIKVYVSNNPLGVMPDFSAEIVP